MNDDDENPWGKTLDEIHECVNCHKKINFEDWRCGGGSMHVYPESCIFMANEL